MDKLRKPVALLCTLGLAVSLLGACSPSNQANTGNGTSANAGEKKEAPLKLSMLSVFYEAEPPKKDNPIIVKLQEYTNTELDITWIPSTAYNDKIATMMVANDLPKVFLVTNDKDPLIRNGIRSGMFWELGPYLKNYKYLGTKMDQARLQNSSVDGKTYGIYRTRDLARRALTYRQDWLDNLGMKPPQTMDEVYNMLKAFTFNDPDKNGKDDTIGLIDGKSLGQAPIITGWYGGPNVWQEDGTPDFMTDAYLKTMKFYKRLYDEKILNQDFGITEETQKNDAFMKGKAGAKLSILGDLQEVEKFEPLFKMFPDAKIDAISMLEGSGKRSIAENGYTGVLLIPKASVKTEDELKRILTYFDTLYDPKVQNLFVHGIEGDDYKVIDGKVERLKPLGQANLRVGFELGLSRVDAMQKTTLRPEVIKGNQMVAEAEKFAVTNPFTALDSKTYLEKGAKMQQMINDARIKFIMGVIDEKAWKDTIEQWRKDGGDKMIEEYKAEYAKLKK
jgi:putative aldouronate transport system substrate-binding protein